MAVTIGKIIEAANRKARDSYLGRYTDIKEKEPNKFIAQDTLGGIVASKIFHVFSERKGDEHNIRESIRTLEEIRDDISRMIWGINRLRDDMERSKKKRKALKEKKEAQR